MTSPGTKSYEMKITQEAPTSRVDGTSNISSSEPGCIPLNSRSNVRNYEESTNTIPRKLKVKWMKGTVDEKRIIHFFYNRGSQYDVLKILNNEKVRERVLQVLKTNKDTDLSGSTEWQLHYINTCLTCHRYFVQQPDATTGFIKNMSNLVYYLRQQKDDNLCFLQAACITMSYMLQSHGKVIPPADGTRLIRNHFSDDQLYSYIVKDKGGDSIAMLKILEKKFFNCHFKSRPIFTIDCTVLATDEEALAVTVKRIREGPGLVSKFRVPENFSCTRDKGGEQRPGYARFTKWNEPAIFVSMDKPKDDVLLQREQQLIEKWQGYFPSSKKSVSVSGNIDSDGLTTVAITSKSLEEKNCAITASETCDLIADMYDGESEESESEASTDEGLQEEEEGEQNDHNNKEFHAMVLLGTRVVNQERYWLMQNTWSSSMQIVEMSSRYLAESGASFVFFTHSGRHPKEKVDASSIQYCTSVIAESSHLERADCESWTDSLI